MSFWCYLFFESVEVIDDDTDQKVEGEEGSNEDKDKKEEVG